MASQSLVLLYSNNMFAEVTDQIVANLQKSCALVKTQEELKRFIKHINKNILIISRAIKSGQFQKVQPKLESNLSLLKCFKEQ